jgi:hypothetical protein
VSPRLPGRALSVGGVALPAAGVAVAAAFGYRDLLSAWSLWLTLACLGVGAAVAARAGVRVALVAVAAPFALAADPAFGSAPPAPAGTLVVDAVVSAVAFGFLATVEYGLRRPDVVRRELDRRTRRVVAVAALATPSSYVVARLALGLGWFTAGPAFVAAASVWTLGGLACCGAVAGGFLARGVYAPAVVVVGSVVAASVAAADSAGAMVTELTLLGAGWVVPFAAATLVGLAERWVRGRAR